MKRKIKQLVGIIISGLVSIPLIAQNLGQNDLMIIEKNILSYHFRYALNYDLNLKSDFLLNNEPFFFNELWPKENQNLKLNVKESSFIYPKKGYVLYEITKRGYQIGNDSLRVSKKLSSFLADDSYLVAKALTGNDLKFISGNFFQSSIKNDFSLNPKNTETFYDFLKFRLFNWSLENIEYIRGKRNKLIFTARSISLKQKILIEVNKYDYDQVEVHLTKRETTY